MELFFDAICSTLAGCSLQGFGNFMLRDKRTRPGRKPKTGEVVPIAARLAACKAGSDVPGEPPLIATLCFIYRCYFRCDFWSLSFASMPI
ncbi:HU family DNA-binding protein [Acidithiobacillus ferrivorans]|uniref:HU family DNA-binding protein n=1 Tax=Acidithiobacillus ferrivorans TaxID=160808 RepID=UPI0022B06174|nr:HU family DNA-binding protein [Acidithiobacillus ferrivorans]